MGQSDGNCDHNALNSGFDKIDMNRIELLRCHNCDALYHPIYDRYNNEVILKRVPVDRDNLLNLLECFE